MGSGPIVLTNAMILIGTNTGGVNDLSGSGRKISINLSSEMVDATVFGDGAVRSVGGLQKWTIDMQFRQDMACVDAALMPLLGTTACFEFRALNQCASGNNKRYYGIGIVEKYEPINAQVGKLLEPMFSIKPFGSTVASASSSF